MVRDVTDADFGTDVIERSKERPVVVDFWATWCAPCRHLSPIIERVGAEHAAHVDTLKMDVDANPQVSGALGIRSIPTVVAFRNGMPVEGFLGAQPEAAVREFYQRLLPSEDDLLVASATESGDAAEIERVARQVLNRDPAHRAAIVSLARVLIERGDRDEAKALLARIPEDEETRRLLATTQIAAAGDDLPPRVRNAVAAAADGSYEQALADLLDAVRSDGERDAAKAAMLDIFALLGDDHALVTRYRRELANALF